jgi:hypothetical protein
MTPMRVQVYQMIQFVSETRTRAIFSTLFLLSLACNPSATDVQEEEIEEQMEG